MRNGFGVGLFVVLVFAGIGIGAQAPSLAGGDLDKLMVLRSLLQFPLTVLLVGIAVETISRKDRLSDPVGPRYGLRMFLLGILVLGVTLGAIWFGHARYEAIWAPIPRDERYELLATLSHVQLAIIMACLGGFLWELLRYFRDRSARAAKPVASDGAGPGRRQ